jgi:uncharacterized protein YjeT (DUF2065 family)
MWEIILTAFSLVLVIEGILPFINPASYKKTLLEVVKMPESNLRIMGLMSMIAGVIMLYLVN